MHGLLWGGWEKYGEMGSLFIYLVNFAEITECPTIMALARLLSLIKTRVSIHIAFVLCKAQFLIRLSYYDYHHITQMKQMRPRH